MYLFLPWSTFALYPSAFEVGLTILPERVIIGSAQGVVQLAQLVVQQGVPHAEQAPHVLQALQAL
jgi:hypothetical protein